MKKSHSDRRWSDAPVAQVERTCVDMLADAPGCKGRACLGPQDHRVRPLDFSSHGRAGLRARGCDVRPAEEERLIGRGDSDVLERATALHRVVVTHDLAFGKVEIRGGASFVGIVCLRPGHISAAFVSVGDFSRLESTARGW